jgi:TolB-like protein
VAFSRSIGNANLRVAYAAGTLPTLDVSHMLSLRIGLPGLFGRPRRALRADFKDYQTVAVMDFQAKGVSDIEASTVCDFVRSALLGQRVLDLVDRAHMEQVLQEQELQMSGCTSQECAVQVGKLLSAQLMVTGSLSSLFGEYVLSVSLVDVETARLLLSETKKVRNVTELERVATDIAERMMAAVTQ